MLIMTSQVMWCGSHVEKKGKPVDLHNTSMKKIETWHVKYSPWEISVVNYDIIGEVISQPKLGEWNALSDLYENF